MARGDIAAPERLAALRATGLLDSLPEDSFDRFVRLAARLLGTPTAAVSLVDDHRQFFKSAVGLPEPWASLRETPLSHSFCKHVVETQEPFVVSNARLDPRVAENLAIDALGVTAYAGMPLLTPTGRVLGALCVIDGQPRDFKPADLATLSDLAAAISAEIELRAKARALAESDARYRLLVEHTENCAILLFDRELRFLIADGKAVLAQLGLTKQQIVGSTLYEVGQPESLPKVERLYRSALEGKRKTTLIDRNERTFAITSTPVSTPGGVIEHGALMIVDVTDFQRTQAALRDKTELLQSVLDHLHESVVVIDLTARQIVANQAAKTRGGDAVPDTWAAPHGAFELDGVTPIAEGRGPMVDALAGREVRDKEMIVHRPNGEGPAILSINAGPLRGGDGIQRGAILVARDITEAKRAARALEDERSYVRLLSHLTAEVLVAPTWEAALRACLVELMGHTGWCLGHVLGYDEDEQLLFSENIWNGDTEAYGAVVAATVEARFARGEGFVGKALASGVAEWGAAAVGQSEARRAALAGAGLVGTFAWPVTVGAGVAAVLELFSKSEVAPDPRLAHVISGVTLQLARVIERERHGAELAALSLTDELTGLHNRRGFLTLGKQALQAAQRDNRQVPLFFVDLDGLKIINDTLGHKAGDRALVEAGNALRATFREADIAARLGGDEFVVLAPSAAEAELTARLEQKVAGFNELPNRDFRLAMSVGVTTFDPTGSETIDELLVRADAAMYEKKRLRRGVVKPEKARTSQPRVEMDRSLSYEALVRLQAITATLTGPSTQTEIASVALRECLGLLGARAGSFRLAEPGGDLTLLAAAGHAERASSASVPASFRAPMTDAVRTKMPIFLGSRAAMASDYPDVAGLSILAEDHAWAALPLMDGNRAIGVLLLSFGGARAFAGDDRTFLMAAASQFATALARAEDARRIASSQ